VEAVSADWPHRETHAFLTATELATVPNLRVRGTVEGDSLRADAGVSVGDEY